MKNFSQGQPPDHHFARFVRTLFQAPNMNFIPTGLVKPKFEVSTSPAVVAELMLILHVPPP